MTTEERVDLLYRLKDNMLKQLADKDELTEKEMNIAVSLLKDNKVIDIKQNTPESELIDSLIEK